MDQLIRTARTTGWFYVGLAVTGLLGYFFVGPQLFDAGDPAVTLANVRDHESLARWGIAVDLGIVLSQALVALWFFRLFRSVDSFAAGSLTAFGLVNATAILVSAGLLATALDVALQEGGSASDVQLMFLARDNVSGVAALFFGLWLVPMGWLVLRSRWMPRALGWLLIAGGCLYVLSTFVAYLVPSAESGAYALTIPATLGEFWMIGYLLIRGVRRHEHGGSDGSVSASPVAAR